MLKTLDLFSGIGGFSLGLERTGGFETVAFCEIEPFCRKVLAKHWPEVPIYEDVRELDAKSLRRAGIDTVDVICGGFPCQDISVAGKGAGLEGARSGLWSEYRRLICELRPRFVIVENVSALLVRGIDRVLGELAESGYDAIWDCIPASAVGAPHQRDRVWIIAHASNSDRAREERQKELRQKEPAARDEPLWAHGCGRDMAHPNGSRLQGRIGGKLQERSSEWTARPSSPSVADAEVIGRDVRPIAESREHQRQRPESTGRCREPAQCADTGRHPPERYGSGERALGERDWWSFEPDVGRVAYDVPSRVDRLKSLGNAVVNEIPFILGKAILAAQEQA